MFIGEHGPFVWLTYLGQIFSLLCMYQTLNGDLASGLQWYILATLCDLFDGRLARSFKRTALQEKYGQQIDTLSDMVNFAFVPVVLLLASKLSLLLRLVLSGLTLLSVTTRLAYFQQIEDQADQPLAYFIGLPAAYAGLIYPCTYLLTAMLAPSVWPMVLAMGALLLAILHVSRFKVAKPGKKAYVFYLILAVLVYLGLGWVS